MVISISESELYRDCRDEELSGRMCLVDVCIVSFDVCIVSFIVR